MHAADWNWILTGSISNSFDPVKIVLCSKKKSFTLQVHKLEFWQGLQDIKCTF